MPSVKDMKRILLFLLLFLVTPVWAGPYEDALAAGEKGDYITELRIIRPLAVRGEDRAQFFLGVMYSLGQGLVKDDVEAVKWYRLAASQGSPSAQHNLGLKYAFGEGVAQDDQEAVKWYRLAAAQGEADSQLNLGIMYGNGEGVLQDFVRAHMWFNLAAVSGNKDAIARRDIASGYMTQQQIAEAQTLARECLARRFKECD